MPTVTVEAPPKSRSRVLIINQEDFDPKIHRIVGEPPATLVTKYGKATFNYPQAPEESTPSNTTPPAKPTGK